MKLDTPLSAAPGIGPKIAQKLAKLGLEKVEDLIHHYPARYEDFSQMNKISELKEGEEVTVGGDVWQAKNSYTKFGKVITKILINDGTGALELTFFNQPYLIKSISQGDKVFAAGRITKFGNKVTIIAPDWEKWESGVHTGRLVPIYPSTAGLTSKFFRNQIAKVWPGVKELVEDPMPEDLRFKIKDLREALEKIHYPKGWEDVEEATERLSFDELFLIQLKTQRTRYLWQQKSTVKAWKINDFRLKIKEFVGKLPFQLTKAQNRVIGEIEEDLGKIQPMNRLLQGEVGSGKTVVAAQAIYLAHLNGFKSLLMAPTEILAWQHEQTLKKLLEPFGIQVGLYTGSRKFTKEKIASSPSAPRNDVIANGVKQSNHILDPDVIVGTHALLSDKLTLPDVGLVIIDEQHRFGVEQRALLRQKGASPHLLTMTATPIPRTVALTLYGDLDLSVLGELPSGRVAIKTHLVPEHKRDAAYGFIKDKVKSGDQVYIITPLIEESETLTLKSAKLEFERLQKLWPELKIGLLHGKLKSREKGEVISDFKDGKIQVLVSTSVVEVGMDIPNATIMLIEGAERFGLAQLHQLRGRIGRGAKESFCLLFSDSQIPQETSRLKNLETTFDGLKLAEIDLKIRGAGTIFGTAQHGRFNLKLASLTNLELIEDTKAAASKILKANPSLDKYPQLKAKLATEPHQVSPD